MTARDLEMGSAILLGIALTTVVAMLVLPGPEIAWNAGARDSLTESLRRISRDLVSGNGGVSEHRLDPRDFVAWRVKDGIEPPDCRTKMLADRYGVSVRWHRNGAYEEVFFCPTAVASEVVLEPRSNTEPTPQIVMVPIDHKDTKLPSALSGGENNIAEGAPARHLRRMRESFSAHGMDYAAALMSDGSVAFVRVDDLGRSRRESKSGDIEIGETEIP